VASCRPAGSPRQARASAALRHGCVACGSLGWHRLAAAAGSAEAAEDLKRLGLAPEI
jgi:hypothetical protein